MAAQMSSRLLFGSPDAGPDPDEIPPGEGEGGAAGASDACLRLDEPVLAAIEAQRRRRGGNVLTAEEAVNPPPPPRPHDCRAARARGRAGDA